MSGYFVVRAVCLVCSVVGVYASSQKILENKTEAFELNNSLITTSFNNNLVDSVKFENGRYKIFLLDEDMNNSVYSKYELSSDNITLLNRISFQDIPVASKSYILKNLDNLIEYEEIDNDLAYFKVKSAESSIENSSLTELEYKVEEGFNDKEVKLIKRAIKLNKRR